MSADNMGMILRGDVGTGKTYMAASIANALIEQEVSVLMNHLGDVINATFEVREEIMTNVKQSSLLIIDDFGMEMAFQVIDARCRCDKPLIITTDLTMNMLKTQEDVVHRRIYDRVLMMCPEQILFKGPSLRSGIRDQKKETWMTIPTRILSFHSGQKSVEVKT